MPWLPIAILAGVGWYLFREEEKEADPPLLNWGKIWGSLPALGGMPELADGVVESKQGTAGVDAMPYRYQIGKATDGGYTWRVEAPGTIAGTKMWARGDAPSLELARSAVQSQLVRWLSEREDQPGEGKWWGSVFTWPDWGEQ